MTTKTERFNRIKNAATAGLIALVVAALTFGVLTRFIRPVSPPMSLTAGTGFVVTSNIYSFPSCSGSSVPLVPGANDCAVFTVRNNLSVPINVQTLSMKVSDSPTGCPPSDFSLPAFTGSLTVPGSGISSTSGLPISLVDTHADEDACAGATISFTYAGTAVYTDVTTTSLAVSPSAPASGGTVTLTATVTGVNASTDPASPAGSVSFNSCTTSDCGTSTPLGTASVGSDGVATMRTSVLATGTHYVQAVYSGSGTEFSSSSSTVATVAVGAPVSAAGSTPGSGSAGTAGHGASTSPSSIAFTGADIAGMAVAALVLIGSGTLLVVVVRRRRQVSRS